MDFSLLAGPIKFDECRGGFCQVHFTQKSPTGRTHHYCAQLTCKPTQDQPGKFRWMVTSKDGEPSHAVPVDWGLVPELDFEVLDNNLIARQLVDFIGTQVTAEEYDVEVYELHSTTRRVTARSHAHAVRLIHAAQGEILDNTTVFIERAHRYGKDDGNGGMLPGIRDVTVVN